MKRFDWNRFRRGARSLFTHPKPADFSDDDQAAMTDVLLIAVFALAALALLKNLT